MRPHAPTSEGSPELKSAQGRVLPPDSRMQKALRNEGMPAAVNQLSQTATLLVVEADEHDRAALSSALEAGSYRVLSAADAPTALKLLHEAHCDLILLASEMPGVDGLALCRVLRAQAATKRLPIIVLATEADEELQVGAFAAGADDFVVKPAARRELLSRVSAHLEAARRERMLAGSNRELAFLADLGRGLLVALEPLQVVRRVAGATYDATNAALAACVVETEAYQQDGASERELVACVFDREGSAEGATLVDAEKLRRWLATKPSAAVVFTERADYLLRDDVHRAEYVAPLRFAGQTVGALVC